MIIDRYFKLKKKLKLLNIQSLEGHIFLQLIPENKKEIFFKKKILK